MKDATYILRKCRAYHCICGWICFRPLRPEDSKARPWPVPCDKCDRSLTRTFFEIWDMKQVDDYIQGRDSGEEQK